MYMVFSSSPFSPFWSPLVVVDQHEYQHQLEFTHEGSTTSTSTKAVRAGRGRGRVAVPTGSSLNGTGARGRKLAVGADRRRAERSLRQGVGQGLLDVQGGDAREAQRTRWVMRMQEQMEEKGPADSARAGPRQGVRGSGPSLSSDGVQLLPIPSPPSTLLRHLSTSSQAAPLETGQRRNGVVGRKRVSHGWRYNRRGAGVSVKGLTMSCVCDIVP